MPSLGSSMGRQRIEPALQTEAISLLHITRLPTCQIYFIIVLLTTHTHTHLAIPVCLDMPVS